MVAPQDSIRAVARALERSTEFPNSVSTILHEADPSSEDADVDLPLLEIQPIEVVEPVIHNTDLVGYATDSNGNEIAAVYDSEYEMRLQLDIWTSTDDGYDPDDLGDSLRRALYNHSSYGPKQPLPDEDGSPITDIFYFRIGDGDRTDDMLRTPTVRRWSQEVELWAFEQFRTDIDYVVGVNYPQDGDFTPGSNGDLEATQS